MEITTIITIILIGLSAGILGGALGIGGGIIVIPALIFILGFSVQDAQGTMLAMMVPPIGYSAFISYKKKNLINFKAGYILMIGFVIASYFGSKLSLYLPDEIMRKAFGVMVILLGIKMVAAQQAKK